MEFDFDENGQMFIVVDDPLKKESISDKEDILLYPKEDDFLGASSELYIFKQESLEQSLHITHLEETKDAVQS